MSEPDPPPGFEPLFRTSPFLETTGPFFYRKEPQGGFVIGLRVLGKHANARGSAHGGLNQVTSLRSSSGASSPSPCLWRSFIAP